MGNENLQSRIHRELTETDIKFISTAVAVAYTVAAGIATIEVTSTDAAGTVTITLPPVSESLGRTISIRATAGTTAATTVQDQNDSKNWSDLTLDTNNDHVVLYCDGLRWLKLVNGIA